MHEERCSKNLMMVLGYVTGEYEGIKGAATTFTPVDLWDMQFQSTAVPFEFRVPDGHNTVVFVRRGSITIGGEGKEQEVGPQGVALMNRQGTHLRLVPKEEGTRKSSLPSLLTTSFLRDNYVMH